MMNFEERTALSTFMTLILRHKPHKFGVSLDPEGYCSIDSLLMGINQKRTDKTITKEQILEVVAKCSKQRFELREEYIRARYGHSRKKIEYPISTPPDTLIHGTHTGAVEKILQTGLKKMERDYVHLSDGYHFAKLSGERRGDVVYFLVDTKKAIEHGVKFRNPGKEVWLSDDIPPSCIQLDTSNSNLS